MKCRVRTRPLWLCAASVVAAVVIVSVLPYDVALWPLVASVVAYVVGVAWSLCHGNTDCPVCGAR